MKAPLATRARPSSPPLYLHPSQHPSRTPLTALRDSFNPVQPTLFPHPFALASLRRVVLCRVDRPASSTQPRSDRMTSRYADGLDACTLHHCSLAAASLRFGRWLTLRVFVCAACERCSARVRSSPCAWCCPCEPHCRSNSQRSVRTENSTHDRGARWKRRLN